MARRSVAETVARDLKVLAIDEQVKTNIAARSDFGDTVTLQVTPQQAQKINVAAELGKSSLTFDVLAWLSTRGIPLIQVNWQGEALVVAGGVGYAADPQLVEAQRAAHASKSRTMEISRWLVAEKIARSAETLAKWIGPSPARERALSELAGSAREMKRCPPATMDALRGVEGRVAQAYFSAWRSVLLSWKGLGRKPIPQE